MADLGLVATLVVTAALTTPLAAQADSNRDDAVRIRLVPPASFATTADCSTGAAIYGISLHRQIGSGANCILDEVPEACPPHITAQFCQAVSIRMKLSLRGGNIKGNVTIFEAWNCSASCAIDQAWSWTVTHAVGRFHQLEGGLASGGGVLVFETFELLTFDEVVVIAAADEHDD